MDEHLTMEQQLVARMKKAGVPVTRENYLHWAYGTEIPEPWTPEHEADLPAELQDWSKFN